MNKFAKFGAVALLGTLLAACGPEAKKEEQAQAATAEQTAPAAEQAAVAVDAKTEYQQVLSLDKEFAPALSAVQQKMGAAQDQESRKAAVDEYFSVMEGAITKYDSLDIKDAEVKSFRDNVVTVLKETLDFTKEAISATQPISPETQKAIAEKQSLMVKHAEELQKLQQQLNQKFAEAAK